jgi:hypothetical protein
VEVDQAPTFTSGTTASFTAGTAGTFQITTGPSYPVPSISETGPLPAGINFTDNGDGTATISGTAEAIGTYTLSLTSSNGIGQDAGQPLTISIAPPAFGIVTEALPDPEAGVPYGPVTLQVQGLGTSAEGHPTTVRWRRISLTKGLRLSLAGVLSGTPRPKYAPAGSITVEATETVVTLRGNKKVESRTTVVATIPFA